MCKWQTAVCVWNLHVLSTQNDGISTWNSSLESACQCNVVANFCIPFNASDWHDPSRQQPSRTVFNLVEPTSLGNSSKQVAGNLVNKCLMASSSLRELPVCSCCWPARRDDEWVELQTCDNKFCILVVTLTHTSTVIGACQWPTGTFRPPLQVIQYLC